jgi:hypothetical protein
MSAKQYLCDEIDPILSPIVRELARLRPHGKFDILKAMQELVQAGMLPTTDEIYHPTSPHTYTPVHIYSCNKTQLPLCKKPDEVTKEWLSKVMAAEVESFKVFINAQGQQGVCVILKEIKYAGNSGNDRPSSCAVKMHAQTDGQRLGCVSIQSYSTEMIFYAQMAASFPVKSPKCYAIVSQQAQESNRANGESVEYFNLVMQDLSVDYEMPGGTIQAGMNYEQTKNAIDAVSEIHLQYWHPIGKPFGSGLDPALSKVPFVSVQGKPKNFGESSFYGGFWHAFKDTFPFMQATLLNYPGCKHFPGNKWPSQFTEIIDLLNGCAKGDTMSRLWGAVHDCADPDKHPTTFVHGDFNAGNIWIGKDGKDMGMPIADWQLSGAGVAGSEFPTLLGTAKLKDGEDLKLMQWYYDKICTRNPQIKAEWSFERFLEGFFHQGTTFLCGFAAYCAAQAADLSSMTKEKAEFSMIEFWPLLYLQLLRALLGCGYKEWLIKRLDKAGGARD